MRVPERWAGGAVRAGESRAGVPGDAVPGVQCGPGGAVVPGGAVPGMRSRGCCGVRGCGAGGAVPGMRCRGCGPGGAGQPHQPPQAGPALTQPRAPFAAPGPPGAWPGEGAWPARCHRAGETPRTCPALPLADAGRGAWSGVPRLYKGGARAERAERRWSRPERVRCVRSHARAVGAAGGRRAGPPGDLRLRVPGQRLRLGGRCRVRRGCLPAGHGPGAAARPRGRAAVRQPAGRGAGGAGPGPAGRPALLAAADAGAAAGAGAGGAAAPGVQRALRAARGPAGPVRGARQGLPRRGAHRRRPRRGAHLPAHPGAAPGLPPLAQDPGTVRLGAGLRAAEAEHGLQGDEEEAVQLRAAARRGVLSAAPEQPLAERCGEPGGAGRLPAAAVVWVRLD